MVVDESWRNISHKEEMNSRKLLKKIGDEGEATFEDDKNKKRCRDVDEQTAGRKKKFKYALMEEGWGERKSSNNLVTDSAETVCQVIL